MLREIEYRATSGVSMLVAVVVALLVEIGGLLWAVRNGQSGVSALAFALIVITLVTLGGFFVVNPGEAKVLQLFGEYRGSVCAQGVWFANPFLSKKTISRRIRNFETAKLKVNDSRAN